MSRLITRTVLGFLCTWTAALSVSAAVYVEDFSADPGSRGWRVFGNSNLFQWNKGGQNLDVTWNSSEPNSFFFMSLGTVLAKSDDFSFTFELKLKDLQFGTSVNRTNTFQVAAGLMNFRSGTNANYYRGAGTSAAYGVRNVAEWDFF